MAVLLGGAILMALEVAAFRVIGRTFGSALRETTAVISIFLTAMSIGYYGGGRAGDRWPRIATLASVFFVAALFLAVVPRLDGLFSARIATSGLPMPVHAFAATTVMFFAPILLLSAVSPIAVRLFANDLAATGRVAGGISALSTIGSVAGSVVTAFVLIDVIGSINRTVIVLAILSLLSAAALVVESGMGAMSRTVRAGATAAIVLVGAALIVAIRPAPRIVMPMTAGGSRILLERDTPYHQIRVIDNPGKTRDLWMDGTHQSSMDAHDPRVGLPYTQYLHIARVIRPSIRKALLIGVGGGTTVRQLSGYYLDMEVDAIDVDPVVMDIAQRYFHLRPSDRVRLFSGDGRSFLAGRGQYDLISIDVAARGRYGTTIPPHMVTREFFAEAARHLSDGGILHFHCYLGRDNPLTRALDRTLASVFPAVVRFGETEFLASTSPLHYDTAELMARAGAVRERVPQIDERIATLKTERLRSDDVPLLTDDFAPVDTLLRRR